MMSTKHTELSTSDIQLTCFAHLLINFFTPALANIGNCELYFLNFCVIIVKKNLQFKGPFPVCNITAGHWPFSDHFCSSARQFQLWLAICQNKFEKSHSLKY